MGGMSAEGWREDAEALWQRMNDARRGPTGTLTQRWIPGVCKHEDVRCVHGDEIIARNFRRAVCLICGRALDRDLPRDCWFSGQPHPSAMP
jgi:hypothetical protein